MPTISIPEIKELPTTAKAAAEFIWFHQDRLNSISHPNGMGTIEMGKRLSEADKRAVVRDYELALLSEVNELQENFFWKHWSAEAKAGKRWMLLHPDEAAGEGTAQNVRLEITDLLFFTVSLLQTKGYAESDWVEIWGALIQWQRQDGVVHSPENVEDAKDIIAGGLTLIASTRSLATNSVSCAPELSALLNIYRAAGITWEKALDLYAQKLIKNYERQARGRKQLGDEMAGAENAGIK
jgi:hypothetical protein